MKEKWLSLLMSFHPKARNHVCRSQSSKVTILGWAIAIGVMTLTTSLYAANDGELLDTVKTQEPVVKTEQDNQQSSPKIVEEKATADKPEPLSQTTDKPQVQKRNDGRFIPTESISQDFAVSFPVDI
jgi:hypothetical protein